MTKEEFIQEFSAAFVRHSQAGITVDGKPLVDVQQMLSHMSDPSLLQGGGSIDDPEYLAYVVDLQRLKAMSSQIEDPDTPTEVHEKEEPPDRSGIARPLPADSSYADSTPVEEVTDDSELSEQNSGEEVDLIDSYPSHLHGLLDALDKTPLAHMGLAPADRISYTYAGRNDQIDPDQRRLAMLIGALMSAAGLLQITIEPQLIDYLTGEVRTAESREEITAYLRSVLHRGSFYG